MSTGSVVSRKIQNFLVDVEHLFGTGEPTINSSLGKFRRGPKFSVLCLFEVHDYILKFVPARIGQRRAHQRERCQSAEGRVDLLLACGLDEE